MELSPQEAAVAIPLAKFSPDEKELLLHLSSSAAWKVYKKILNDQCIKRLWSAMPMKEPLEIKEAVSIAAGVNLSVNLLDRIVAGINKDKNVSGKA